MLTLDNKPKILLRLPNWIGDLVMASPLIKDVRSRYPDCTLGVLCTSALGQLLKADSQVDHIHTAKDLRGLSLSHEKKTLIREIKEQNYQVCILTTNSFSSAYFVWRLGIPYRIGFANDFRSCLLTHPISYPTNKSQQHLVKTYKLLLQPIDIEVSETLPYLIPCQEAKQQVKESLEQKGVCLGKDKVLCVNPGAAYGSAKCWPPERFAQLIKRLVREQDFKVVFIGAPDQGPLVEQIKLLSEIDFMDLVGRTNLAQLLGVISSASIMLSNDSGPMHLSYALGTPVFAIFGSTNDVATGPYCLGKIIHKRVSCSPCYERVCPYDFRCMKKIESDEVFEELTRFYDQT